MRMKGLKICFLASVSANVQDGPPVEKHVFQAETNRLMDILVHSLYTDKSVFLRELLSNSTDALEKARFLSVSDEEYLGEGKDLEIKIDFDEAAKTLSITDTGVGMTKEELINNLGTVAKSGTTNFVEAMQEGQDANLIGQFGVGFYSAFLMADKVTVTSKNNTDPTQNVWESSADSTFTVSEDPRGPTLQRGSRVTLHLKDDALDLLSEQKLKELALKYSQFMQFPIYVKTKKEVEADADDVDDEEDDEEDLDDEEEKPEETEGKKGKKVVYEWEQVNTQKAVWMRSKENVTPEEYVEFYKAVSKDYQEPLAHTHFSAEGELEFKSILYLPKKAPFDHMGNGEVKPAEVKLYVRRVLVAEKFEELLPKYLNFVKGVVDSEDLPLNVNREQLQQNKVMKIITKKLVRKVLELLKQLSVQDEKEDEKEEDEETEGEEKAAKKEGELSDYAEFYKEFKLNLHMGCYEDDANRSKIAKLLRFHNTTSTKQTSLSAYLDRMGEKQQAIYFITGDKDVVQKSPNLQMLKKKGIEVLILESPNEEACFQKLADFEGKKFVSAEKADVKLDETEEEKKRFVKIAAMFKPLTEQMQKSLTEATETGVMKGAGVKIEKVEVSKRLVDAPCVVVAGQYGYSPQYEKAMRAQSQANEMFAMMAGRKTLEINAAHPLIFNLLEKVKEDAESAAVKEATLTLFQTGLIASGYELLDPSALVASVHGLMAARIGVDMDAPLKEIEVPEDEEEPEAEEAEEVEVQEAEEVETIDVNEAEVPELVVEPASAEL